MAVEPPDFKQSQSKGILDGFRAQNRSAMISFDTKNLSAQGSRNDDLDFENCLLSRTSACGGTPGLNAIDRTLKMKLSKPNS